MAATFASVENYLTLAQTSFSAGDYTSAKKYIVLGHMELKKLPASESDQGTAISLREGFKEILSMIESFKLDANRGSRRSYLSEI